MKNKAFDNLEDAYNYFLPVLISLARNHVYNPDLAFDAVHIAFEKALEYKSRKPDKKISGFLLKKQVMIACKKLNRYSNEVSCGLLNGAEQEERISDHDPFHWDMED